MPAGSTASAPTLPLAEGENSLTVTVRDLAGNPGLAATPITITVDTTAPGAPVLTAFAGPTREAQPVIAGTAEAGAAIRAAMEDARFGAAGARLVIEECLEGPEVSFFALCDGSRAIPIVSAQDHKRIFDGDKGPNTGGMGAFAPSPLVDAAMEARIMREIVEVNAPGISGPDWWSFDYRRLTRPIYPLDADMEWSPGA